MAKPDTMPKTTCYHCGDNCEEERLHFDNKDFCCQGCKTVYEILNENGLDNYYALSDQPGLAMRKKSDSEAFAFLDNEEIKRRLVDFSSEDLVRVTFYLPAVHCSSCIWLLENLYRLRPGIRQSRVNFVKRKATFAFHPSEISLRELAEVLDALGYPPYISLEEDGKKKRKKANRSQYLKIGVAGFAFGNIMLLSLPEYFGFEGLSDDDFYRQFFSYANILLSLPVIFYCASDYFKSALQGLKERYINIDVPIALGILTLFSRSMYEVFVGGGPGYFDSLAGLLFFLLVGKWFQGVSYDSLSFERDYKSYFPLAVNRIGEDGEKEVVPVADLAVGDKIVIRNGEIIPSDSELISDRAHVNYSFVTGEADPVTLEKGAYIYAGGRQEGQSVTVKVKKPVSRSYLTELWNQEAFKKSDASSREQLINVISKYFTLAVLLIAGSTAAYWMLEDPSKTVGAFTAVLIVACPCALALAAPFALGTAQQILGREKVYLKNPAVAERLSAITDVVFDKTGTLTHAGESEVEFEGETLTQESRDALLAMTQHSTHPLSRKVFKFLGENPKATAEDFKEIEGKGLEANVGGKLYRLGSAKFVGAKKDNENELLRTQVYVSEDGQVLGRFVMSNRYRSGLETLLSDLGKRVNVHVLSGDNESERERLEKIFPQGSEMRFDQSPHDKLEFIKELKSRGGNVMMLGDGLNDAGALKQSDVGVAVTEEVGAFTPSCDAIMQADSLARLGVYLRFSKAVRRVILAGFVVSFLYNIVGLSFAVSGALTPVLSAILMPVSSVTVVAFSTLMSHLTARMEGIRKHY
ncbi:ATPase [Fulvitalea axinellae]|uniref:ATPase n=1 Tax=Fulvitalea axinellae TaxID=1182444 RepID=A0AAU9CWE7_9BACT|nr:ATPase [Fulvitalea axinellae]